MILSIIVPVFNVEKYLRRCLESLLDQDLTPDDYEIILIDDGSTDTSGSICDEYASREDNIKVIHQANQGLSAARNKGVTVAGGNYVQFVDSDDYLCPNVLGGIIKQLDEHGLDILRINYQNVNEAGAVFEPNQYSKPFDNYSEEVCDGYTFLRDRLGMACYAVQFVVKASLLKQDNNGFKEGIYYEDVEWAPRILLQARRVASCKTVAYNYLSRMGSITRNADMDRKRKSVQDKIGLIGSLKTLNGSVGGNRWFDGMIAHTVLSVLVDVGHYLYPDRAQYIRSIKDLHVFPLSTYKAAPPARRKIIIANLSPALLCLALHYK